MQCSEAAHRRPPESADIFPEPTAEGHTFSPLDIQPCGSPLQKPRRRKAYSFPDDLEVLNEIPCFVAIHDFADFEKPRNVWANSQWLKLTSQTLQQFQELDFAGAVSAPMKKKQYDVGQEVQIKQKQVNLEMTIYDLGRPLQAMLLHQPILVQGRERPLLANFYYNTNAPLCNPSASADPLDFHHKASICQRVHEFPRGLELLNEAPVFTMLFDFHDRQHPKKFWANAAWLEFTGQSLEEHTSSALAHCSPSRLLGDVEMLFEEVQQQRKTVSYHCSVSVPHQTLRARAVFRPLLLDCVDRPLLLCALVPADRQVPTPPTASVGAQRRQISVQDPAHLFKERVVNLLNESAIMFNFDAGLDYCAAVWSNWGGRREYGLGDDESSEMTTAAGTPFDLQHVLDSCLWQDDGHRDAAQRRIRDLRLESDPVLITCRKRARGGRVCGAEEELVWHHLRFSPCKNPYTGGDCLLLQESDVTKLMHVQEELKASIQLKDNFLQCVSHEFRTPLNGIIGLTASICTAEAFSPRAHRALAVIEDSAKRLSSLVNDILEMAECMAGSSRLDRSPVNLSETCERVCDFFRPRLRHGVQILNSISDGTASVVEGDAAKLLKVFTHLIDNAVKYTAKGSIEIVAHTKGDSVRVEVRDTGCGIRQEELATIWQHFQQGDMSVTRSHGGTGLGLALVKSMVEAHGGKVSVQSNRGGDEQGTTMAFTLPVQQQRGLRRASAWEATIEGGESKPGPRDGGKSGKGVRGGSLRERRGKGSSGIMRTESSPPMLESPQRAKADARLGAEEVPLRRSEASAGEENDQESGRWEEEVHFLRRQIAMLSKEVEQLREQARQAAPQPAASSQTHAIPQVQTGDCRDGERGSDADQGGLQLHPSRLRVGEAGRRRRLEKEIGAKQTDERRTERGGGDWNASGDTDDAAQTEPRSPCSIERQPRRTGLKLAEVGRAQSWTGARPAASSPLFARSRANSCSTRSDKTLSEAATRARGAVGRPEGAVAGGDAGLMRALRALYASRSDPASSHCPDVAASHPPTHGAAVAPLRALAEDSENKGRALGAGDGAPWSTACEAPLGPWGPVVDDTAPWPRRRASLVAAEQVRLLVDGCSPDAAREEERKSGGVRELEVQGETLLLQAYNLADTVNAPEAVPLRV